MKGKRYKQIRRQLAMFISLVGLVALFTISTPPVEACSCGIIKPLEEELRDAEIIFSGKAVEVDSYSFSKARFQVHQVWKGAVPSLIEISVFYGCDDIYSRGEEYLIFAYKVKRDSYIAYDFRAGGCGQTTRLKYAQKSLDKLGKSYSPRELTLRERIGLWGYLRIAVAGGAIILALTIVGIILKRKIRTPTPA